MSIAHRWVLHVESCHRMNSVAFKFVHDCLEPSRTLSSEGVCHQVPVHKTQL